MSVVLFLSLEKEICMLDQELEKLLARTPLRRFAFTFCLSSVLKI